MLSIACHTSKVYLFHVNYSLNTQKILIKTSLTVSTYELEIMDSEYLYVDNNMDTQ